MSAIQRDVVSLVQAQRWAALCTVHHGNPLASMVAYAIEPDLNPLLFISDLAAHTRALIDEPRCSLAVTAPDTGEGDPQLLPRVSLQCTATPIDRDAEDFDVTGARYVQRFPDALMRFQLGDFRLFRLTIDDARYVGGFARASSITGEQLREAARELAAH
jgi:putative heme iron utilization protein